MDFLPNLSLQRFSTIAYAKWLWNHSDVQSKLHNYRHHFQQLGEEDDRYKHWKDLVKPIVEELRASDLPWVLLNELIDVIVSTGYRIYIWHDYVLHTLSLPPNYAKPLYWTAYGTIDQAQIMEKEWFSKKEYFNKRNMSENEKTVAHYTACLCAVSSYIHPFWTDIVVFCKKYSGDVLFNSSANSRLDFILQSLNFFKKTSVILGRNNYLSLGDLLNDTNSFEQSLFIKSIGEGCDFSVRYYWKLLNSEEKEYYVVSAARECLAAYDLNTPIRDIFGINYVFAHYQYYPDIMAFLLMHMSKDQLNEFLLPKIRDHQYNILKMWVTRKAWPWQELFFPIFDMVRQEVNLEGYCKLLNCIVRAMDESDLQKDLYRKMLLTVWSGFRTYRPNKNYLSYKSRIYDLIMNAFFYFNIDLLGLIADHEIAGRREDFLKKGRRGYKRLFETGQTELLNKFMEVVLRDEEECKWFKNYCSFVDEFINEAKFEAVDNFLEWKSNSDEELEKLRKDIDIMSICYKYFDRKQIDLANKAYSWWFSNEEERKKFITNFEVAKLEWIFNVWNDSGGRFYRSYSCLEEHTLKFLHWFFRSEKEISLFRKTKIINENIIKNFVDYIIKTKGPPSRIPFERVEMLFKFCSYSRKKIQELKRKMSHIVNECILLFCKTGSVLEADDFLSWLLKGKKKKVECIKNFLNSTDVALFLKAALENYYFQDFSQCLRMWISVSGDLYKIKSSLDESFVCGLKDKRNLECLLIMLDTLKED